MRHGRISWKRGAALALLLMLVVPILAACGGGTAPAAAPTAAPAAAPTAAPAADAPTAAPAADAPTAAPAEAPTAAPAEAPTAAPAAAGGGDTTALKILEWQAPTILNTHLSQGTKDSNAAALILEPLAAWGDKSSPIPILAAEIPTVDNGGVSKDLTSVTWKLKSGIKWSDGSDFTADDVVFTWEYCADPATACTSVSAFDPIAKVEAVDPQTVKITWKEPNANSYIAFVGGFQGVVLQKKQFTECKGAAAATCAANNAPIGTGPFVLKEFKAGDVATYEKNPAYRDAAKVAFNTVEIKGGGDAVSAARAVCETGEVDYAWNLQVEAAVMAEIVKGGKCTLLKPSSGIERLLINFANPDPALGDKRSEPDQPHPILSDLKVRQALALAIDKKTMAEQVYGEAGEPTCNILTEPADLASPNTKCDQDIEGAKKLLDEAGWTLNADGVREKDGVVLALSYQTTINAVRQKEQALVKANWAEIGVTANLKAIDAGVFFSSDAGNPDTGAHFFADIEMFTNSNSDPDPTTYFDGWTCAQIAQKSNGWSLNNYNRYCSKDYDALMDQLKKELDPAKRKELYIKLNDQLANDVVNIPLINRTTPEGAATSLVGPAPGSFSTKFWKIAFLKMLA
jgi:peptide/nickel transport system substrate-binding protein